jgi:hypothetical protein
VGLVSAEGVGAMKFINEGHLNGLKILSGKVIQKEAGVELVFLLEGGIEVSFVGDYRALSVSAVDPSDEMVD